MDSYLQVSVSGCASGMTGCCAMAAAPCCHGDKNICPGLVGHDWTGPFCNVWKTKHYVFVFMLLKDYVQIHKNYDDTWEVEVIMCWPHLMELNSNRKIFNRPNMTTWCTKYTLFVSYSFAMGERHVLKQCGKQSTRPTGSPGRFKDFWLYRFASPNCQWFVHIPRWNHWVWMNVDESLLFSGLV